MPRIPAETTSAEEAPLFDHLWTRFNQLDPGPSLVADPPTYQAAFDHFSAHDDTRVINLNELHPDDESYLQSNGIILSTLFANLRRTLNRSRSDSRAFQLTAIRDRCIYAISPFSGALIDSRQSLPANINTIFYRFSDRHIFYVVTSGVGSGYEKQGIYFPTFDLIVRTGERWAFEKEDLIEFKAGIVSHIELCRNYLKKNNDQRRSCVLIGFYHFAHHLWNELTGLERLRREGLFQGVDTFLVLREPLGPIRELFPEIDPSKIKIAPSTCDLLKEALSDNFFVVRVGGTLIPKSVIKRVNRVASRFASNATKSAIAHFKTAYSPILWVGIRVGTRTCSNQVDALGKTLQALRVQFPKIGVVFDGFSLPGDREDPAEYATIIEKERRVVDEVRSVLGPSAAADPAIANIIGSSIFDAIVWAQAIDCYMAPFGTIQHKVGWFAAKDGLIHANESFLKTPNAYAWTAVEGIRPPHYVALESISDVPSANAETVVYKLGSDYANVGAGIKAADLAIQSSPEFNSYTLEWRSLASRLVPLLEGRRGRSTRLSKVVLTHRVKTALKAGMRYADKLRNGSKL
jgi:hypothetical protein